MLSYEGTLYGETTNYAFVGAKMIDKKEREAKRQREMEQIRAEISQRRREGEGVLSNLNKNSATPL